MMKKGGLLLIWLAFLCASLVASLAALTIQWQYFVPILIVGFLGVVMVRVGTKQHEQAADRMKAQAETLGANAILDTRFTTSMVMSLAAEILVFGTAVVIERDS